MSQTNNRSPARTALASHLERLREANEAVTVARRPFDLAADQAEHARRLLSDAEGAVAALDQKETALIGDTWPPKAPAPKLKEARAAAQDNLDHARRVTAAINQKYEAARQVYDRAAIAVRDITSDTAALINAVMADAGHDAVARLGAARAALAQDESAVNSIRAVLVERQAFREAEAIAFAVRDLRWPEHRINSAPYRCLAERLLRSADAVAE